MESVKMGNTLENVKDKVAVAAIQVFGEKLTIPEGMSIKQAMKLLKDRDAYENEVVNISETFNVMPQDGANGLNMVLSQKFGWAQSVATPGFFGDNPPTMLRIEYDYGKFREVPWGRFTLPTMKEGYIETSASMTKGRWVFKIEATILRKNEEIVRSLCEELREYLKNHSIYMGKAVKIRFRDNDGKVLRMPELEFMDTSNINPDGLIYSRDIQDSIETNLFTPITRIHDLLGNGLSFKRGVLLGGTYGTGKTLAATVASKLAVDNGITYVYAPRADELSDAIEFAKQYQSPGCVIFCEDIDRAINGERSVEMDDILNILDGIDTKSSHILTVLTTNDLSSINPAMLRPGRLDAVIDVTPPDAEAAARLVKFYGGEAVAADADLTQVGEELNGVIPAVIAEVVKRAKLAQIRLQEAGTPITVLSEEALLIAAKNMKAQVEMLADRLNGKQEEPTIQDLLNTLIGKKVSEGVSSVESRVEHMISKLGL